MRKHTMKTPTIKLNKKDLERFNKTRKEIIKTGERILKEYGPGKTAKLGGVNPGTLSAIAKGKRKMSLAVAFQIVLGFCESSKLGPAV